MSGPLFNEPDPDITLDLAKKIGVDVIDLIQRTMELAPPGKLPIATSAALSSICYLAKHLEERAGIENKEFPMNKTVFVAALIVAHMIVNKDINIALEQGMRDCDLLIKKGRIP